MDTTPHGTGAPLDKILGGQHIGGGPTSTAGMTLPAPHTFRCVATYEFEITCDSADKAMFIAENARPDSSGEIDRVGCTEIHLFTSARHDAEDLNPEGTPPTFEKVP